MSYCADGVRPIIRDSHPPENGAMSCMAPLGVLGPSFPVGAGFYECV